jgi:hypothetical protein
MVELPSLQLPVLPIGGNLENKIRIPNFDLSNSTPMKTFYTFAFIIAFSAARAQFSVDPANPFAVADAPSTQEMVRHLGDGNGGYFLFWLDKRDDGVNKVLYGQHLDPVGVPLWIPNGKPIAAVPGKTIVSYTCKEFDGGILLAWFSTDVSGYGDSLQVKKIDANGDNVWNEPATIAVKSGTIGITPQALEIMPNDSGAFITYTMVYIGGSSAIEFNRVDFNGNRRWPMNSNSQTVNGYDYRACNDGHNGIYVLGKGNGLGSTMFIQRFDLQGNAVFLPVEITGGGGPAGFGGNITLLNDADGNLYCVYDGNNSRIYVSKMDSSGNMLHTAIKIADHAPLSSQFYSSARLINGKIYACWNDDRNGQIDLYAQRVDTSCAREWSDDGIFISPSYLYCRPKIALSDSNAVAVFHVKTGTYDVAIQRIRQDSTLTWSSSYTVGNAPGGGPTDNDAEIADDAGGCNAVFWSTGGSQNIYGAKLCSNGQLINVPFNESQASLLIAYPNPVAGLLTISTGSQQKFDAVRIFDSAGRMVMANGSQAQIDVSSLSKGLYVVQVVAGDSSSFGKFVKE